MISEQTAQRLIAGEAEKMRMREGIAEADKIAYMTGYELGVKDALAIREGLSDGE